MKVLLYISSLGHGGKERQLVELVKGLVTHEDFIFELAIMSNHVHYTTIYDLNVRVHHLLREYKKDPRIFIQLYRLCKKFKPDIIHTWDDMTSVYAVPIAKIMKIKLVNGMIRNAPPKLKPFGKDWMRSRFTFPFSDQIVSNSHAGIESYRAPYKKSVCIHNGFDFQRVKSSYIRTTKVREKFGIKTEKIVGMVANFSPRKDYETYIKTAQILLKKRDDVSFLTIGDGANYEKVKRLVIPKFNEKIKFLGKQQCVESIINSFDIGVLTTYTEGISNTIMEYMALGKPVIATDGGGTKEIVVDKVTGFLVGIKNAEEIVEKLEFLLNNKAIAKKMGKVGKERLYQQFSKEKMTESYAKLYKHFILN